MDGLNTETWSQMLTIIFIIIIKKQGMYTSCVLLWQKALSQTLSVFKSAFHFDNKQGMEDTLKGKKSIQVVSGFFNEKYVLF